MVTSKSEVVIKITFPSKDFEAQIEECTSNNDSFRISVSGAIRERVFSIYYGYFVAKKATPILNTLFATFLLGDLIGLVHELYYEKETYNVLFDQNKRVLIFESKNRKIRDK